MVKSVITSITLVTIGWKANLWNQWSVKRQISAKVKWQLHNKHTEEHYVHTFGYFS